MGVGPRPIDCQCDAQYSGRDEAEYRARGCPSCTCTFEVIDLPMLAFEDSHIKLWKDIVKEKQQDQMDEHMVKTSSAKKL